MQATETLVRNVVAQVLSELSQGKLNGGGMSGAVQVSSNRQATGRHGVFNCVDAAAKAARSAFEQLSERTIAERGKMIERIRRISIDQSEELGNMEMDETRIGRREHKIEKLRTLGERTPGIEFMQSQVFSGDHGLAVIEHAPFGVIGAITPVTHSLPTITGNAINMLASGNTLVVNPHPAGKRIAAEGVRRFNQALVAEFGIDNLICVIEEPTLESAQELFHHRDIALICVTGGPAVARAAMNCGKRAIVAGPGNPPVVVDETADLDRAARAIIRGASYDNNLLCIAEKEVFVVAEVFDAMLAAMSRAGAVQLNEREVAALTARAIETTEHDGRRHQSASKEFLGQDASKLAHAAGKNVSPKTELLFGATDEHNPFVAVEQMMPFVPFVRCQDVEDAIAKAKHYEHGYRHTSIIHSNSVRNMTRMGRAMDTTLFVKNGPSFSALGVEGEGYISYSIATPTGEGVTTPMTFTRERRCSLIDDLRIVGATKG